MDPNEIKDAFEQGENITQLLRRESRKDFNTEEAIEIAYDLQSGSYVSQLDDPDFRKLKQRYSVAIAEIIQSLGTGGNVLEAGVGECTTLSFVMAAAPEFANFHGFDISWSRIACGRSWLESQGLDAALVVASIFHAPYVDDSFDIVYTSHSIEPNGGNEAALLKELYRVTRGYLVLVEPGYEFANTQSKKRMENLGYVREIKSVAESLGMKVIKHEPFSVSVNEQNPSAVTIIEKNSHANGISEPKYACPKYGDAIIESDDSLYAPRNMMAYPKILGIPCLRKTDGVIASKYIEHSRSVVG